jgi:hypothetical protein
MQGFRPRHEASSSLLAQSSSEPFAHGKHDENETKCPENGPLEKLPETLAAVEFSPQELLQFGSVNLDFRPLNQLAPTGASGSGTEVHWDANVALIPWTIGDNIVLIHELIWSSWRCFVEHLHSGSSGRIPVRHCAMKVSIGVVKLNRGNGPPKPGGARQAGQAPAENQKDKKQDW